MSLISKPSINIGRIKTFYFILALILLIIFGFLAVIPQVIPSWEIVQEILVGVIYVLNIVLVYIIIKRSQKFFSPTVSKKQIVFITTIISFVLVIGVIYMFIFTSFGFGQGFMGSKLEKEFNYPDYKATIYIYDAGFLDPATAIKIKKGRLPLMKDVKFLAHWLPYKITESHKGDIVQLSFNKDTVKISLKTGKLISE